MRKFLRIYIISVMAVLVFSSCSSKTSGENDVQTEIEAELETQTQAQSEYEVMTEIPVDGQMLAENEQKGEAETFHSSASGGIYGSEVSQDEIDNMEFEVFSNDGIEILRPKDWENTQYSDTTACFSRNEDSGYTDSFVIAAMANDLDGEELSEYIKEIELNFTRSGYEPEKSEIIEVNGYEAAKLVFIGNQDQYTLKGMQIFIPVDDEIYIINFIATQNQYDGLEPVIEKMVDSFKF